MRPSHQNDRIRVQGICVLLFLVSLPGAGCSRSPGRTRAVAGGAPVAPWATCINDLTIAAPRHLVAGFPALNEDGSVNAVVEIPAGTTAKFEVENDSGVLRWEIRDGKRRVVDFLGYPGNYGMVPSTLLPKDKGGDDDPVDILVLGTALERAQVVRVKVIAVLRLRDDQEIDHKLIAVPEEPGYRDGFSSLDDLADLEARYPLAKQIIELWFTAYKGPGVVVLEGWAPRREALDLLRKAAGDYAERRGRRA